MTKINPQVVKSEIASLLATYPELADDETFRRDMIEAETDALTICRQLVGEIIEADIMATGVGVMEETLKKRRHRFERGIEARRRMIHSIMNAAALKNVSLPEATLSIRAGTQAVVITDEAAIPESYIKIERSPKRAEIKEALKNGTTVPGAMLSNGAPSLSIRMT
jgi:hypothetical protein